MSEFCENRKMCDGACGGVMVSISCGYYLSRIDTVKKGGIILKRGSYRLHNILRGYLNTFELSRTERVKYVCDVFNKCSIICYVLYDNHCQAVSLYKRSQSSSTESNGG